MTGVARLVRARDLDLKSDRGLSLAELLVTMLITGILLTIVGNLFINVAKVTTNSNASTQRLSVAGNVMDELSKVIRTATNNAVTSDSSDPAVVSGTPAALTIYSYVDANAVSPAPTKVGFRVDASGNLIEDRWTASTSSTGYWVFTGSATSRTIGSPVQTLTGTDALFIYLDDLGAPLTPGANGLTALQRSAVASIKINVRILNQTTLKADPIIVTNTIGMPNLKISKADN